MSSELDGFPDIPHEIITEIFLCCLPTLKPHHVPDPRDAPILLTHVCSSWRIRASQVPELWTTISLPESMDHYIEEIVSLNQRRLDQLSLWKRNSHNHPLDIFIQLRSVLFTKASGGHVEYAYQRSVGWTGAWDNLLAQAVVENAQRLRQLYLKLHVPELGAPIYALPAASMPNLEILQIHIDEDRSTFGTTITSFGQAPNLRRVTLRSPAGSPLIKINLPWAQLTHLALLTRIRLSFFHFITAECPRLRALSLHLDDRSEFEDRYPATDGTIMTNLQQLSLQLSFGFSDSEKTDLTFLSSTTFPFLYELRVVGPSLAWIQPFPDDYLHFINQLHLLRSLTLNYQNIPCDELLEILRQTPLLVELVVDSAIGEYSKFLESLTYKPEVGPEMSVLVPELEIFNLYVEIAGVNTAPSFTTDSFFNMIISRSNLVIPAETGYDERTSHPKRLKNVLLCIEEVNEKYQTIDPGDLASRLTRFVELDSGILLVVDFSSHFKKTTWLEEGTPTW